MDFVYAEISILRVQNKLDTEIDDLRISSLNVSEHFVNVEYQKGIYVLLSGPEIYNATKRLGNTNIKVAIKEEQVNELKQVLLNKVSTEILNPMYQAYLYDELTKICGVSQTEIAKNVGKTQGAISNKKRLLCLSVDFQLNMLSNKIKERHGRSVLELKKYDKTKENMDFVLKSILKNDLDITNTENLVASLIGKEVTKKESLIIKELKSKEQLTEKVSQVAINQMEKEIIDAVAKINKYFPNMNIEIEKGISREDFIFLVKMKGLGNG